MSSTSPGMSIHSSVLTSCMISDSGNSGARSAGPTGSLVPGCSGGSGCMPAFAIDGMMLNHAVGISSCDRSNRVCSLTGPPCWVRWLRKRTPAMARRDVRLSDRHDGDLEPAIVLSRGEERERVAGGAVHGLAGLEIEDALARGARQLRRA